jgi:hypothetical protein
MEGRGRKGRGGGRATAPPEIVCLSSLHCLVMMKSGYMQLTYRPYMRASNFCGSSSLGLTQSSSTWNQSHIGLNGLISLI